MERHRILVVDDDRTWLEIVKMMLSDEYDLELTTQPSRALTLVKSTSFSLAVLDQRISPDISGVELLVRLRECCPSLRGIILTGFAELEDAVESVNSGAFDYISKGRRDLKAQLRLRVAKALATNLREQSASDGAH